MLSVTLRKIKNFKNSPKVFLNKRFGQFMDKVLLMIGRLQNWFAKFRAGFFLLNNDATLGKPVEIIMISKIICVTRYR